MTQHHDANAEKAKELLMYYFERAKPGVSHGDSRAEIREIVDLIIDAAVDAAVEEMRARANT